MLSRDVINIFRPYGKFKRTMYVEQQKGTRQAEGRRIDNIEKDFEMYLAEITKHGETYLC